MVLPILLPLDFDTKYEAHAIHTLIFFQTRRQKLPSATTFSIFVDFQFPTLPLIVNKHSEADSAIALYCIRGNRIIVHVRYIYFS
jgi:hypothetical protein